MDTEDGVERLDDLLLGGMKIYQRTDQFCFSLDAILLAHFATFKRGTAYVDLGTGTGVIPLVATHLGCAHMTGIEINPVMAELAAKSVKYNHREDRISIVEGDYRTLAVETLQGPFQGALVNPPYRKAGSGFLSATIGKAVALHESETTLEEVAKSIKKLVKFGGQVFMIHLAERLADILDIWRQQGIEVKRLRFVHSDANKEAKLVLLEGRIGGKSGVKIEPPLYIYNEDKSYTEEVRQWYGK